MDKTPRILIIDDDLQVCETMLSMVQRMHYDGACAHTIRDGLQKLQDGDFDIVFLDVRLPDGDGIASLPQIKRAPARPEVIILTGKGDPDGAELAIQGGVWDYLVKPSPVKNTKLSLQRALAYRQEKQSRHDLEVLNTRDIIGKSPGIKTCFERVSQASRTDFNVLIIGETGTGKELFARTIHKNSLRAARSFVVVDCASLSDNLLESILFGHRKGSFTGADQDHPGLVRQAHQGTLFLDEIGELPLNSQKAFLRVLQEKKFRPVGSSQEVVSDFRLIAATHRDLPQMVKAGQFREDLFYRLKTIALDLPPLRERREDLSPLTLNYLAQLSEKTQTPPKGVDPEFFQILEGYDWPGNVRELFHTLEQAVVVAGINQMLFPMHLPKEMRIQAARLKVAPSPDHPTETPGWDGAVLPQCSPEIVAGQWLDDNNFSSLKKFKHHMEKIYFEAVVRRACGDIQEMMNRTGLSRSHLYAMLKKHHIRL
jgi:two-component system, NtrC family, response regulator